MFFNSKKRKKVILEIGRRSEEIQGLYDRGYYDRGLELAHETMHMTVEFLPRKHPLYAASLCHLAAGYQHLSIHDEALKFYQQALDLQKPGWRRRSLAHYLTYAETLGQIGMLHHKEDNLAEAEKAFREVMRIRRRKQGRRSLPYTQSVYDLAALYRQHQQYAKSEKYYLRACKLAKKSADSHPGYVGRIQSGLAHLYLSRGKFGKAAPLYEESLANIRKDRYWDLHLLNDVLSAQGIARAGMGRPDKALESMLEYVGAQNGILERIFTTGSQDERRAFLNEIAQANAVFLSLIAQHFSKDNHSVKKALEMALGRKTLAIDAMMALRKTLAIAKDPRLKDSYRELNQLNVQIAEMKLAGPASGQSTFDHMHEIMQRLQQAQALEERIHAEVFNQGLAKDLLAPSLDDILARLPPASVYIEIVKYDRYVFDAVAERGEDNWQPPAYLAFVVHSEKREEVKLVSLGEASRMEAQIADFRSLVTREKEPGKDRAAGIGSRQKGGRDSESGRLQEVGQALRKTVFDPLAELFRGTRQIFLAADGELTRLPFEILPLEKGKYLIDEYQFVYLASGRDLLRSADEAVHPSPPIVMADPDFNLADPAAKQEEAPSPETSSTLRSYYSAHLEFDSLPGTRVEGIEIAKLLKVQPFLGQQALENVLRANPSPFILHLATHGYFLPAASEGYEWGQGNRLLNAGIDTLLQSGVALAGVNSWLKGQELPAAAGDGLLNAEEVAALDLSGTELVVLSACETGLGEVLIGEGVQGLRRSFMIAGAKSVVVSLWKVPDAQTQELMVLFYRKILAGRPRGEALREAQLEIRANYPHPSYWGAFICVGESGPLPGRGVG